MTHLLTNPEVAGAIAILGFLAGLIGVVLTWRANSFAKRSAKAQKLFEPRRIQLSLFGHHDIDTLFISAPLKKGTVLTAPIEIGIQNPGSTPLHHARLAITSNKDLSYGDGLAEMGLEQGFAAGKIHTSDDKDKRSVLLDIEKPFYAGMGISFSLPLTLATGTRVDIDQTAETKDHTRVRFTGYTRFAWTIDVVLLCEEERPLTKRIRLYIIDTNSEDPLKALAESANGEGSTGDDNSPLEPFLYAPISQANIRPGKFPRVLSADMDTTAIKVGFRDSKGGQLVGSESPANPMRRGGEKLIWLLSHGYDIKQPQSSPPSLLATPPQLQLPPAPQRAPASRLQTPATPPTTKLPRQPAPPVMERRQS